MRRLMQIFMVLFVICLTADAQTFSENFTGLTTGTNLAGQSSWTKGGTGPDVTVANATPLTYPLYNSGGGEYVVMPAGNATASRVYKTFAVPQTNYTGTTFYYSFLLNLTTAVDASVGYFMSLGVSGTSTSYGAKLFAKKNGAGYNIGLSKTSNTAVFGSTVLELNKTYLIVVRYTFNAAGLNAPEKYDDVAYLWVNPQGPAEPSAASAECTVPAAGTDTDMDGFSVLTDVGNIVWHNRGVTNPSGAFDGILVGHGTTSAQAWTNLNAGLVQKFDDPQSLTVKNADGAVTLDGKLDEADWTGAPTLVFGNGAYLNKQAGESTVTGGADIKASFDSYNVTYHKPNTDSSVTRVKFLRKGTDLYIGLSSNDKSICRFDWEGDGLFLKVKNSAGVDKEYKLYYQNIAGKSADTMRLEEAVLNSSAGIGFLPAGSTANDTTNVDNGYTAEFKLKLASLGFDASTTSLQVAMSIFDPDGFQFDSTLPWPYGMIPFDSARGSYYKSWWGSEWGGTYRTLALTPEPVKYDDPQSLTVKNADNAVAVDGKLDEADWTGAPTLVFGNGAYLKKQAGESTVTNGADIKASFDSWNVTYHKPNTDSSVTRVKFLRKGTDLFIGLSSNDKSICRFDWEGDGLFLKIKNAAGVAKEYKLYYQNIAGKSADTMRLEEAVLNSSAGVGVLATGSTANDTTNVDNGYTAEFKLKLASLGFDANTTSLEVAMSIFDPDGFQFDSTLPWPYGMMPFDSARGSYFKSWWGSEWGDQFRTLTLQKEVVKFDDPQSLTVKNAGAAVTVDGKLDEGDWNGAPTLVFGNGAFLKKQAGEATVTNGADIKASFDSYNVTYHKPNTDSSVTRVKFLRKGTDLFIGLSSNDKSICRFDWEGDGLFLKVKNSAGVDKEYKLYYQNIAGKSADTMRLEEAVLNSSAGVGVLATGSTANDTTNVDNGYTAEFKLKLASLGFDASTTSLQVAMSIFDPDGFQFDSTLPWPYGMMPFDSARGSYYKSWWGSEWGGTYRTLALTPEYDNPDTINTVTALTVTLDGKLDEAEWASAPALVFGPANAPKSGTDKTVTNGVDVKASFDSYNVTYHMPYKDTSYARVKFIQKGMNLYIGITSNDKSICKFDWEGDGMFLMIKNSAGVVKQYKLYYQNLNDTIRYEEDILNSGAGAGYLFTGSKVNDTTQVDAGYSAELMVKLGSLGYDQNVKTLPIALNVFDPDGYQHPMAAWDSARGSFYKSWWGSEWGSAFKTVKLQTITSVANGTDAVPTVYALSQNYPNPFNPTTMIKFSVPQASLVKIVVYDLIGREVATLVNGTYTPGFYNIPFNAQHVASGMYLYRMTSTSLGGAQTTFTDTKKLMLVK